MGPLCGKICIFHFFKNNLKGNEFFPQTLTISLYILATFDISNYKFCKIKQSKFEISSVYIIWLQSYRDQKFEFVAKTQFLFRLIDHKKIQKQHGEMIEKIIKQSRALKIKKERIRTEKN